MNKQLTLTIIHQHPHVLLGMKKRGFGVGKWNGFGGKVHAGESVQEAAKREVHEEAGIVVEQMAPVGMLELIYPDVSVDMHVFRAEEFTGTARESEEMRPPPSGSTWQKFLFLICGLMTSTGCHYFFPEKHSAGNLPSTNYRRSPRIR